MNLSYELLHKKIKYKKKKGKKNNVVRKLDMQDKKLLYEIDFDARKTYAELARTLRMSKRGVEYKLKNLERDKIILGYSPIIDINKLGYNYFRVFIKFQTVTSEFQKEVELYLVAAEDVGWALWNYGAYDLGFTVWATSVSNFKTIVNKFYDRFGKNISRRAESIGTAVTFFKSRFLLEKRELDCIEMNDVGGTEHLDEHDRCVLTAIVNSPRASLTELGVKSGISSKLVAYHLKKLIAKKVLLGVRPILDFRLLGKTYQKILFHLNNLQQNAVRQLEQYLSQEPSAIYIVHEMGMCDVDVELVLDSSESIYAFIENLQSRFPSLIKEYEIIVVKKICKQIFLPKTIRVDAKKPRTRP